MSRRATHHRWADHPELLTSIRTPWEMFQKADWNFEMFESAVFKRPCDPERVMYSALDFCVALVSLRDWTKKFLARELRQGRFPSVVEFHEIQSFSETIAKRVRWQSAVEAIANTTKHATYRDAGWKDGIAMPASYFPETLRSEHEACKDGLELFAFMHRHRQVTWWDVALRQHNDHEATPGYIAFGDALDDWKRILIELGFDED